MLYEGKGSIRFGFGYVGIDKVVVAKEEADTGKSEDDIYAGAQSRRLFEGEFLGLYGSVLPYWGELSPHIERSRLALSPILVR